MRNILSFCDTAISHSNIDVHIVTKNIAVHRRTSVSLQPYSNVHTIVIILLEFVNVMKHCLKFDRVLLHKHQLLFMG